MTKSISINGKRITATFSTKEEANKWHDEMIEKHSDKSLENEVWISIENHSRYEVSNFGRVRSLNYKNTGMVKVLSPGIDGSGYLRTMIQNDNKKYTTIKMHRVVCAAFLGNQDRLEVNHKNGIKTDNNILNLEWCTRSENCQHSFDTGLQKPKRGELNGMAKLTKDQVEHLRNLKSTRGRFWGRNELAKEYGISAKHLQKIVNNTNVW